MNVLSNMPGSVDVRGVIAPKASRDIVKVLMQRKMQKRQR